MICLKIRTFVVSATTLGDIQFEVRRLWFAWKFVPLWYQQQPLLAGLSTFAGCDLLENSYLCGISNNDFQVSGLMFFVVICLKIRTFVVSATTSSNFWHTRITLWFAWKFVPLWYQQQRNYKFPTDLCVVICLKIRTFVVSATTRRGWSYSQYKLWFAWKFVPLWYQQQQ